MTDPHAKFWARVDKGDGTGCWIWQGAKVPNGRTRKPGYGVIKVGGRKGRMWYAHRWAWTITNGEIPAGQCVLHECDTPQCVRPGPGHLFLGTQDENNKDMARKGRWRNQYKDTPPAECKRGHPFSTINTRKGSHGERVCRTCAAMWMRSNRATEWRPAQ